MYYVYILQCCDGTFYTGSTSDLSKRLNMHNSGRGAKYTRGRRPVRLAYAEPALDRSSALRREAQIKRLSRAEKIALIARRQDGGGEEKCPETC